VDSEFGKQSEVTEILLSPACLQVDDAPERARPEGIRGMVEGERDSSSVRMEVMTVASFLAVEGEAIGLEGEVKLASVIDRRREKSTLIR